MPFNQSIGHAEVGGLIPNEISYELLKSTAVQSVVMKLGRRLRNMSTHESELPVLSALASASIRDGEYDLIETTKMQWENKVITAKHVDAIVVVSQDSLADSGIPLWDEVKPELVNASAQAIDLAMLYGTGKPSAWPTAIVTAALAASHNVSLAAMDDLYDAMLGDDGVFAKVEADGYEVTGIAALLSQKAAYRNCRTTDGVPVFQRDPVVAGANMVDGVPIEFLRNGVGNATYKQIAGDWKQLVYSMRQDIAYEVTTTGVIQDGAGNIMYNMFQQHLAAIKLTMRLGFQLPNPINRENETAATRYPFAYLTA
jgi:HK97 family phage major capsid protein